MTEHLTLPHLDIVETNSDFDEAIIMIDGHEEETIRIECESSRELAEMIVRLINGSRGALEATRAADC